MLDVKTDFYFRCHLVSLYAANVSILITSDQLYRHDGRNGLCTVMIDATCGTPARGARRRKAALKCPFPMRVVHGGYGGHVFSEFGVGTIMQIVPLRFCHNKYKKERSVAVSYTHLTLPTILRV